MTTISDIAVEAEWGVCYTTHTAGRHVEVKSGEVAARRWLEALRFCGNTDAVLVARADRDAAWIPVGGAA